MSLLSELIDVVEHLVHTHPTFNQSLTQVEALEKLAKARAVDAVHSGLHVPVDATPVPVPAVPVPADVVPTPAVRVDPFTVPVDTTPAPVVPVAVPEAPSV
jgi:hypothetical protein